MKKVIGILRKLKGYECLENELIREIAEIEGVLKDFNERYTERTLYQMLYDEIDYMKHACLFSQLKKQMEHIKFKLFRIERLVLIMEESKYMKDKIKELNNSMWRMLELIKHTEEIAFTFSCNKKELVSHAKSKITLQDLISNKILKPTDMDVYLQKGLQIFLDDIMQLDNKVKKYAYTGLLTEFFINLRQTRSENIALFKNIADDFHNLPMYLANNLEGFDDYYFWEPISVVLEKSLIVYNKV